jgi:hypothetical protein
VRQKCKEEKYLPGGAVSFVGKDTAFNNDCLASQNPKKAPGIFLCVTRDARRLKIAFECIL